MERAVAWEHRCPALPSHLTPSPSRSNGATPGEHPQGVSTSASASASDAEAKTSVLCPVPTHLLVELTSLEPLSFPTSSSKRIRYTCLSVSPRLLVVGTSTGSVYVFARFATRQKSASVPVQVFSTRDGPVYKTHVAVGSESGRVSVAALGPSPSTSSASSPSDPVSVIYSAAGDARKPDRVTALAWKRDATVLYAGHASGAVAAHRVQGRSLFRAACERIADGSGSILASSTATSEIIQLELSRDESLLLVSAALHTRIHDLNSRTSVQVGKKPRNGHYGACFFSAPSPDVEKENDTDTSSVVTATPRDPNNANCEFVLAARPNGRLWEANAMGVVYSTHQFRQVGSFPSTQPISSFRVDNAWASAARRSEDEAKAALSFSSLYPIQPSRSEMFVLSIAGSWVVVVSPDGTRVVLLSNMGEDVRDVSVCGADVFVLSGESGALRKFTLFERMKACRKLVAKSAFIQTAQLVLLIGNLERWENSLIDEVCDGLASMNTSQRKETQSLLRSLRTLFPGSGSSSIASSSGHSPKRPPHRVSSRLPSGIHRVIPKKGVEWSGVEDDFTFRPPTPLRERSLSTPVMEHRQRSPLVKRASLPAEEELTANIDEDVFARAKALLDGMEQSESLRTLLGLHSVDDITPSYKELHFKDQTTLAAATRSIAKLSSSPRASFADLVVKRRATAPLHIPPEASPPRPPKRGARVVKAIKPIRAQTTPETQRRIGVIAVRVDVKENPKPVVENTVITSLEEKNSNCVSPAETTENPTRDAEENYVQHQQQDETAVDGLKEVREDSSEWAVLEARLRALNAAMRKDQTDVEGNTAVDILRTEEKELNKQVDELEEDRDESEEAELIPEETERCRRCKLHRSWLLLTMLGSAMQKPRVLADFFPNGGVPVCDDQWRTLFKAFFRIQKERQEHQHHEQKILCESCHRVLRILDEILEQGASVLKSPSAVASSKTPSRSSVRQLHDAALSVDEGLIDVLFEKKHVTSPVNGESKIHRRSSKASPIKKMEKLFSREENGSLNMEFTGTNNSNEVVFAWLADLSLSQVLTAYHLSSGGSTALLSWLKTEPWIVAEMGEKEWRAVSALKAYDSGIRRGSLPQTAVNNVVEQLNIGGVIVETQPDQSADTPTRELRKSVIFNPMGNCLICTLSLKTCVGAEDKGVAVFSCGHSYHSVCAEETVGGGCLACRVEERRNSAAARAPFAPSPPSPRRTTSLNTQQRPALNSPNILPRRQNGTVPRQHQARWT